jgi:periplasmic protein TonB
VTILSPVTNPLKKRAIHLLLGLMLAGFVTPLRSDSREPPVPVRTVAPEYPDEMRRAGVSGVVMVNCMIDEKGNVTETSVEKSTAPAFERPALDALKKWKFKPAKQDGVAISVRVTIPMKFVLNN